MYRLQLPLQLGVVGTEPDRLGQRPAGGLAVAEGEAGGRQVGVGGGVRRGQGDGPLQAGPRLGEVALLPEVDAGVEPDRGRVGEAAPALGEHLAGPGGVAPLLVVEGEPDDRELALPDAELDGSPERGVRLRDAARSTAGRGRGCSAPRRTSGRPRSPGGRTPRRRCGRPPTRGWSRGWSAAGPRRGRRAGPGRQGRAAARGSRPVARCVPPSAPPRRWPPARRRRGSRAHAASPAPPRGPPGAAPPGRRPHRRQGGPADRRWEGGRTLGLQPGGDAAGHLGADRQTRHGEDRGCDVEDAEPLPHGVAAHGGAGGDEDALRPMPELGGGGVRPGRHAGAIAPPGEAVVGDDHQRVVSSQGCYDPPDPGVDGLVVAVGDAAEAAATAGSVPGHRRRSERAEQVPDHVGSLEVREHDVGAALELARRQPLDRQGRRPQLGQAPDRFVPAALPLLACASSCGETRTSDASMSGVTSAARIEAG